MSLPVRTLSVRCFRDGAPQEGMVVSWRLVDTRGRPSADYLADGTRLTADGSVLSNADGLATLSLTPNTVGTQNTRYQITITDPDTGAILNRPPPLIQMPDEDRVLSELVPDEPIDPEILSEMIEQQLLARDWATKAEDDPVTEDPDEFSSLHWSEKSKGHKEGAQTARAGAEVAEATATTQAGIATAKATESSDDADRSELARTQSQAARDAALTAEAGANAIADSDITSALLSYGITNIADVFVYDTSKDSDGGAWRDRATWQSWYHEDRPSGSWLGSYANVTAAVNDGGEIGDYYWDSGAQLLSEITATGTPAATTIYRGSKAKFPRTAILVGQHGGAQDNLIILDADDPSLPVWMVFDAKTSTNDWMRNLGVKAAQMQNGVLVATAANSAASVYVVEFYREAGELRSSAGLRRFRGTISGRNDPPGFVDVNMTAAYRLADNTVNAVALYVDPLRPPDPSTGLPRPVIACATAGGVSVIQEDGTVRSSSDTGTFEQVEFGSDGTLLTNRAGSSLSQVPPSWWKSSGFSIVGPGRLTLVAGELINVEGNATDNPLTNIEKNRLAFRNRNGTGGPTQSGVGVFSMALDADYLMASLNRTAWALPPFPPRAIALALSSTDTTDLVAATPLDDDFSGYADQAEAEAAGYAPSSAEITFDAANDQWDWSGAQVGGEVINKTITVEIGARYLAEAVFSGVSGGAVRINATGIVAGGGIVVAGVATVIFTATTTSQVLTARVDVSTAASLESLLVRKVEPDRSGNDSGPIAYGTLSRAPVADGAKITAFSGFSASNYLEHADDHFDPGTGDWSITRVVRGIGNTHTILEYGQYDGSYSGGLIRLWPSGSAYRVSVSDDGGGSFDTILAGVKPAASSDPWDVVTGIRRGSTIELWVNGVLQGAVSVSSATGDLSGGRARHGLRLDGANPTSGQISSIMLDATYAPTAEQIREQHAILAAWHREDADPTILSDTVDALAYDEDSDLLYVSGPSGTTVLHGSTLTRATTLDSSDTELTSNTHKAAAGAGGISAIASANELRLSLPALPLRDKLLATLAPPSRGTSIQRAATTNATPTVAAAIPVAAGEVRRFRATVMGNQAGNPGGESAQYRVEWTARRAIAGNVAILGTPTVTTIHETTGTMDATLAANTTDQLCEITVTGVASTDIVWETRIEDLGAVQ